MLKKIYGLLLCTVLTVCTVGCSSGAQLNKDRAKNYTYDFVQFLSAKVYGPNGYGFLEVKPKELKVSDFKSEKEYIAVKKAVNSLQLYFDQDNLSQATNLVIDKPNQLSNGDIVTLGISDDFDSTTISNLNINLEPFQFQVRNLKEPVTLDLFDPSSVAFLALDEDDNDTIYPVKIYDGAVPDNILDQITYEATTDDDDLIEGETILSVDAEIVPLLDNDGNGLPTTLGTWLGKKGYLTKTVDEKVLRDIAQPVTFNGDVIKEIAPKLLKTLRADDDSTISVATVQQLNVAQSAYDPYDYVVTYYAHPDPSKVTSEDSPTVCKKASVKMAYSKPTGASVLELRTSGSVTNEEYCRAAYSGMDMKVSYNNGTIGTTGIEELPLNEEPK